MANLVFSEKKKDGVQTLDNSLYNIPELQERPTKNADRRKTMCSFNFNHKLIEFGSKVEEISEE